MVASYSRQVREVMMSPGQVNAQGLPEAIQWQRLDDASFRDQEVKELGKLVMQGVPEEVSDWPGNLKTCFVKGAEYSLINNVVIVSGRVVIPRELRGEVLQALHIGHCGVTGMGNRAREVMCWPQMGKAITRLRENCEEDGEEEIDIEDEEEDIEEDVDDGAAGGDKDEEDVE